MDSPNPIWRVRPRHPTRDLTWRYVHDLPHHDSINRAVEIDGKRVLVHIDAEIEPVTATMVMDALEEARDAGLMEGCFGAIQGPQRRKKKRRLNQHRARRRKNLKRRRT